MPKPDDRGSLMNLKTALPKVEAIEATEEMERRIMGRSAASDAAQHSVHDPKSKDVRTDVRQHVRESLPDFASRPMNAGTGGLAIRRREGTVLLNAKVPLKLHTQLKRTAQFNNISMTDILLRGIQSELDSGRYTTPPETWGAE